MRLVVVGNLRSRRTALLRAAVERRPGLTLHLVPWLDIVTDAADLRPVVRPGDILRIDSPGKDFDTEKAILTAGAGMFEAARGTAATAEEIEALAEEYGRIYWPGQWYSGFCRTLDRIRVQLEECPQVLVMNTPEQIRTMFDKTATHERLRARGVRVVPAIGRVGGYDELLSRMQQRGWKRAFVKLAYGSSASGRVALRFGRGRTQAFTTVELDGVDAHGVPRMYNTRKIRESTSEREVARVVDSVCRHTAHAEYWLPKAGICGRTFDLRVLMIAGQACHTVVRLSRTPMTNLHLLNDRSDADGVRRRCGEAAWDAIMSTCRQTMEAFPGSLYAGLDILIGPDFRRHAVLEVNAFGDHLSGALWRGMDCYEAELASVHGAVPAAEVA